MKSTAVVRRLPQYAGHKKGYTIFTE